MHGRRARRLGWCGWVLAGLLLVVLGLLYLSLRHHLGRIKVPDEPADDPKG